MRSIAIGIQGPVLGSDIPYHIVAEGLAVSPGDSRESIQVVISEVFRLTGNQILSLDQIASRIPGIGSVLEASCLNSP